MKINLQFVPVLSKKDFENKYLIKIVVKQGELSRLYCFVHQLTIQTNNTSENHDILYSYVRHNMAGIEELKGISLLKKIREKVIHPHDFSAIFHEGCNP